MRKILLSAFIATTALFGNAQYWEIVGSFPNGDFKDSFFLNENHGWVFGGQTGSQIAGTRLVVTTDGGDTWTDLTAQLLYPTDVISGAYFFDTQHGVIITENGHTCYTYDGGQTWSDSNGLPSDGYFLDIEFDPNSNNGYLTNFSGQINNSLFFSDQDGIGWDPMTNAPADTYFSASMGQITISGNNVIATGGSGSEVFYSTDNGLNWEVSYPSVPTLYSNAEFISDDIAILTAGNLYKNNLSFNDWTLLYDHPEFIVGSSMLDQNNWMVCTNGGSTNNKVVVTQDAGENWTEYTIDTPAEQLTVSLRTCAFTAPGNMLVGGTSINFIDGAFDVRGIIWKFNPNPISSVEESAVASNISIYPNPAEDQVFIGSLTPGETVIIYDACGKEIQRHIATAPQITTDITNLPSGMYHIKTTHGVGKMMVR